MPETSAAETIRRARDSLSPVAPLRNTHSVVTAETAYRVQDENTRVWLGEGRRLVGRKIGLTAQSVQAQLGVDQPDYGMLWGGLAFASSDLVPFSRFMQPRVEAEVAFVLERDLTAHGLQLHDVITATAYVLPAMEIVDSAIAGWDIRLGDTIADNASSGGYVLGTGPAELAELDLRLCGMVLTHNDQVASVGVGAACLGSPLLAVLWLARKMVEVGRPLVAGDLVLSGALGPMVTAQAGDRFTVEIGGLAPLSFGFSR